MDPTCSVVFERQKAEPGIMSRRPRNPKQFLLDKKRVWKIVFQGMMIFMFSFGIYYWQLMTTGAAEFARTMGVLTLSFGSLFLVYVDSSDILPAYKVFWKNIKDKVVWMINGGIVLMLLAAVYVPGLNEMMKFAPISVKEFASCVLLAGVAVFWYDLVKWRRRVKENI